MSAGRWFRVYDGMVDDPKVQMLLGETFKFLVNLWCLASQNGGVLPDLSHIAFKTRLRADKVDAMVADLLRRGLLDEVEQGVEPHNWRSRQYRSDVSTDRVKRFRERKGNASRNVSGNVSSHVSETPPDTETDTPTEKESSLRSPKKAEGLRLPDDWRPDEVSMAKAAADLGSQALAERELEKFRDYWRAVPGAKGRKVDWLATWRNRIRWEIDHRPKAAAVHPETFRGVL